MFGSVLKSKEGTVMSVSGPSRPFVLLSVSYCYHDSSIALFVNQRIVAVVELERLTRSKRVSASPQMMELYAGMLLQEHGLGISDVDFLVVNALNEPYGLRPAREDMELREVEFLGRSIPTYLVRHHYAHSGLALLSPYEECLIASCDGGGDRQERVVYFRMRNLEICRLAVDVSGHTSTTPYGMFSRYIHGEPHSAGKLMGLAAYGDPPNHLLEAVNEAFLVLRDAPEGDALSYLSLSFPGMEGMAHTAAHGCADLGAAVQQTFENRRVRDVTEVQSSLGLPVVISGGSGLNLGCNTRLWNSVSAGVWVPPGSGDPGTALGQCCIVLAQMLNKKPICRLPYTGVIEPESFRGSLIRRFGNDLDFVHDPQTIARRLAEGELCLLHIGRPEVGPRALGHRSFLYGAETIAQGVRLSQHVKRREWFRPLAPVLPVEELEKWFDSGPPEARFMEHTYRARPRTKTTCPAVVHVDDTARVQTVAEDENPFIHSVLAEYGRLTGCPVLINTSLNLRGEPISNYLWDTVRIARLVGLCANRRWRSFVGTNEPYRLEDCSYPRWDVPDQGLAK